VKVGTIGFAGSGKTTLIGSLTLALLQGDTSSDLALFNFEGVETTRDLSLYADMIQRGRWPARTEHSKVAEYSIRLRRKSANTVFSLRLPELPGELLDEVWRTDHIPQQLAFLTQYDGYLLLVDATLEEHDRTAAQHVHLLQGIKRAKGHALATRAPEPLGIVFTKWDALPDEEQALGPEQFAFEHLPLLTDFLHSNFTRRRLFGVSAVGAVDAAGNPLLQRGRIVPAGIFAPLEWITAEVIDAAKLRSSAPSPA
jgi:hypothetical protein